MTSGRRILVIKLGALGDFVQALGPFAAIRAHHPDDHVTLLTTAPFQPLAEASGMFDTVWLDERPNWRQPLRWFSLMRRLRDGGFDWVYDLQTSARSSRYFHLFRADARPEWSGVARGCSHPHANPKRNAMHTVERQREQLAMAGITDAPVPDLTWLDGEANAFDLPDRYALLAAGGAPHRPEKRWPARRFGELAAHLDGMDVTPVFIGTSADRAAVEEAWTVHEGGVDLVGQTSLLQLAGLARRAVVAVGNDSGPMHLAAAAGCPTVVLYARASDPALCGQRGERVAIVRRSSLDELSFDDVKDAAAGMMGSLKDGPA